MRNFQSRKAKTFHSNPINLFFSEISIFPPLPKPLAAEFPSSRSQFGLFYEHLEFFCVPECSGAKAKQKYHRNTEQFSREPCTGVSAVCRAQHQTRDAIYTKGNNKHKMAAASASGTGTHTKVSAAAARSCCVCWSRRDPGRGPHHLHVL